MWQIMVALMALDQFDAFWAADPKGSMVIFGRLGIFWATSRTSKKVLGAAHEGVLSPICSGGLHHAVPLPLRGFATKLEPSISKTLGFMA